MGLWGKEGGARRKEARKEGPGGKEERKDRKERRKEMKGKEGKRGRTGRLPVRPPERKC